MLLGLDLTFGHQVRIELASEFLQVNAMYLEWDERHAEQAGT